jgi:hypothetical protein
MQPIAASATHTTETTSMQQYARSPGRNITEKVMNYLRAQPENGHLGLEEIHARAALIVHTERLRRIETEARAGRFHQQVVGEQQTARPAPFALSAGRNATEKAMNFLRAQPGNAGVAHEDLHIAACELVRQHRGAA